MNTNFRFAPIFMFVTCFMWGTASANNFYVGLNAGAADQSGKFSIIDTRLNPGVGISTAKDYLFPDDAASNYSLLAGYKLGADLAIEVGVANNADLEGVSRALSTTETALEKVQTDYIYAALIGVWPMKNGWALSGRLGFSVWDIGFTQTVTDTAVPTDVLRVESLSDSASATFIGVGISYGITSNIELKLSFEQHNVDFAFTNVKLKNEVIVGTLGMAYHF